MLISTFKTVPDNVPAAAFLGLLITNPFAPVPAPVTAFAEAIVIPFVKVAAGVTVTAPVDTEPMAIVPVPRALIERLAAAPELITANATVPAAIAPATFKPAACEPTDESTLNAGLVVPLRPTEKAFADDEVIEPSDVREEPFIVVPAGSLTVGELEKSTGKAQLSPPATPISGLYFSIVKLILVF